MTARGRPPELGAGRAVRVLADNPDGNPRTPRYVRGKVGVVRAFHGVIDNPLDHHAPYPPLYTVVFDIRELSGRAGGDQVAVDLHADWLEAL